MNDYIGVIFYARGNQLESVFYQKLNALCDGALYVVPVGSVTYKVIESTLEESDSEPNIFYTIDRYEAFKLSVELTPKHIENLEEQFKGLTINAIDEDPSLLHCLARGDAAGFENIFSDYESVSNLCIEILRVAGKYRGKTYQSIVDALNLMGIISNGRNAHTFGSLNEVLNQ